MTHQTPARVLVTGSRDWPAAHLLHLVDRAVDGRLLPAEADQLRDGIRQLHQCALAGLVDRLAHERDRADTAADLSAVTACRIAHSAAAAAYRHASLIATEILAGTTAARDQLAAEARAQREAGR